jgi:hypothetical protein
MRKILAALAVFTVVGAAVAGELSKSFGTATLIGNGDTVSLTSGGRIYGVTVQTIGAGNVELRSGSVTGQVLLPFTIATTGTTTVQFDAGVAPGAVAALKSNATATTMVLHLTNTTR